MADVQCPQCGKTNDGRLAECSGCKARLPAATQPYQAEGMGAKGALKLIGAIVFLGAGAAWVKLRPAKITDENVTGIVKLEPVGEPLNANTPPAAPAAPAPTPTGPQWANYMPDAPFSIDLPSKPQEEPFIGGGKIFTAKLGDADFVAGFAPTTPESEDQTLKEVRAHLANRLGGLAAETRMTMVSDIPASEFDVIGQARSGQARQVSWDSKVLFFAASHAKTADNPADRKRFFDSFKVK
jgi:hypothetical protein